MSYPGAAWERAMRVQEVLLKALSGELHWFRAADILGMHPRSLRRWRERYEQFGYHGLIDKRYERPSKRRVPFAEVERVVRLYRERYRGFNVRHFHQIVRREHAVTLSYSYVKAALQTAGLVKKRRPRGRHRAAASRAPASGSCCTSMAARTRGWRRSRSSGPVSLRSLTMRPTRCCMRRSIPVKAGRP